MPAILTFSGASDKDPRIEPWFATHAPELAKIGRHWFAVMRACGPDVRELMHDGCANVCVQDAPFAYVNVFTAHVNVGFFQGASLADPAGLLEGAGKFMRHVKLKPGQVANEQALEALIRAAYHDIVARLGAAR